MVAFDQTLQPDLAREGMTSALVTMNGGMLQVPGE